MQLIIITIIIAFVLTGDKWELYNLLCGVQLPLELELEFWQ